MMSRRILSILLGVLLPVLGAAQQADADSVRAFTRAAVERHVRSLAADSLKGRRSGTAGGAIAAHYIVTAFEETKALPAVPTTTCDESGRCQWTYFQPVRGRGLAAPDQWDLARNILAVVPGSDTSVAGQWIIVGAHFDTFSYNGYGNVTSKDLARPGADDNASGLATVIELARRLAAAPVRRPVMFVLFAQFGVGSREFLENLQQPADSITAMFNIDMVGRLDAGRLEVNGSSTSRSWRPIIDSAAANSDIRIVSIPAVRGRDHAFDHLPFAERGVPSLLLSTGMHRDWNGPRDTADKVDYAGLVRVVEFTEQLIRLTGDGVRPWRAK
jgi:aminopeptidase N